MKVSTFLVLILWMFLQGMSPLASGYEMAQDVSFPEQCHGYCFSVLQPFLDHLLKLKEATDHKNNIKVEKIHSLELTNNNLQSQLLKSETEIKNHFEKIKDKEEQIKDLREQVKMVSGVLAKRNDQLSQTTQTAENLPNTCANGRPNGIYQLKVEGIEEPFQAPCVSPSSAWTVIQRRIDGSVDFNRSWTDYKDGFGDIRGEFFLGLEKIHQMTLAQPHELYIQLRDVNGTTKYARYDNFKVGSENEAYKLKSLGEYSGTAGDSFIYNLDMKFTTWDRDNGLGEGNCAKFHAGGWWFNKCGYSFLNGKYYDDGKKTSYSYGIYWGSWKKFDDTISLTFTQMMIRPKPIMK